MQNDINPELFNFHDIVISPFIPPYAHHHIPSLVGGISAPGGLHYKFGKVASINCHLKEATICFPGQYMYCGFLLTGYGHFVIESVAHLYFIKKFNITCPLIFSYSTTNTLTSFQRDIFNILNIKNKIIVINQMTKFENIYIPPPGATLGGYITDEQKQALATIDCNPKYERNIYISRSKIAGRGAVNEHQLEKALEARGWKIVHPQCMPVLDQLNLYASAHKILAICGSALFSLLFLKNLRQ